jgi:hypothetical protein
MHESPKGIERLLAWLVVAIVVLQVAANVLPRLLVPIVVLAAVFVVVRLVLFHTRKW